MGSNAEGQDTELSSFKNTWRYTYEGRTIRTVEEEKEEERCSKETLDITDHCPSFIHFPASFLNYNINRKIKIEIRPFNQNLLDLLIDDLIDYDWSTIVHEHCDLNLATEN